MPITATGSVHAKIMFVGEFPNEGDLKRGEPFIGGSGFEFTKILGEVGLSRDSCYLTMVLKDRVVGQRIESVVAKAKKDVTSRHVIYKDKWVTPEVVAGIESLRAEIERVRPNVVVPMGNLALWALTGEWSANQWRSSVMESTLVPGQKVVPTLSVGIIHSQWSQRPVIVHDIKRAARESSTPALKDRNYKFLIPTNNSEEEYTKVHSSLSNLLEQAFLQQANGESLKLAADIETRAGHISCIAFAWSSKEAICIPLMSSQNPSGFWTESQETNLVFLIYTLCRHATILGQNWNYDAQYLYRHWHFLCPSTIDTMIQQHSCFSNMPKNLGFLSSMYLDDHLYWKDDRTNWTEGPKGEGELKYWEYNCTDTVRTYAIHFVLSEVATAMGLEKVNEFQQILAPKVLKTMNRGLRIDHGLRRRLGQSLTKEIESRENWLFNAIGNPINIRSPKQMADFFYRQMGQKTITNRKTGGVTCNDEAMRTIASREPILLPITRKIAEMRTIGVIHGNIIEARTDIDDRMRTQFGVCGTETYRFNSTQDAFGGGMNMQNVTKGGDTEDEGLSLPNMRTLFIPDEGCTFFDIDLDSADLRIVTWESDCKWMKTQFAAGNKPYVEVMKEYYHDQSMSKNSHPREYAMFKSLCHGTNYLGTADGIAPRIGLLVHETERIQKWYFGLCPEIKKWQENIKNQVLHSRYVQNAFGYRNYFFDRIEGTIFNQAVAWIPQSTVACLINRAYVAIDNNIPEVEVLLQVHDSLAGQFKTELKDYALRRIVEESTIPIPYSDPLYIPVGVVSSETSWGECG